MPLINDYLELQEKYEKKYGDKTIVLYECGQFFEIYGVVNEEEQVGKIYEIADITNLSVSKRGGKNGPVSRKNPLMAGFPNHSFEKWKNILLKHQYTIIKIEQSSHGDKDPERSITEIISPGINMDTVQFSNHFMSIYLEEVDYIHGKTILYGGVSTIDVTTGDNCVYELKGKIEDDRYVLDEIFRFIQTYNPVEIIMNSENLTIANDYIISYLEIENRIVHIDNFKKDTYLLQNKYKHSFLDKLFPKHNMLNTVQYLDLNTLYWGLSSYIYLLQFAYEHNDNIVNKLTKPKIWKDEHHLILSYDSINQLNVIPNKNLQLNTKIDSLFNLLDKTSTCLGKRLLKENLLNPILSTEELNKRYDLIDYFMTCDTQDVKIYEHIENYLNKIFDIERIHRKMTLGVIHPSHFTNLDISYRYIQKAVDYIKNKGGPLLDILPKEETLLKCNEFIKDYQSTLNMDIIHGCSQNNIKQSIFKRGVYIDIDELQDKIDNSYTFFTTLSEYLSNELSIGHSCIEIKSTDKEGYYLSTTKKRGATLKTKLKHKKMTIHLSDRKNIVVDLSTLEYKNSSSVCKIVSDDIRSISEKLHFYQMKMTKICLTRFLELMDYYDTNYIPYLKKMVYFISYLDFIKSNSKCAFECGYCRPTIVDMFSGKSYIKARDVRHPIIEKLNTALEYVPNDIDLGHTLNGMLLYGVNAVGKSSYMKSVGLSVIMAQAGLYVPASEFQYYPYKSIFTRISGNDNIFKGQSTFAVEMSELRSILKRADKNSLVLGDELCSGTETISGLSIVSAGVITLERSACSFIFATHLHQLSSMERLRTLDSIKNYHMETIYDNKSGKLIYNRKIKEGSGNAIYGLEVAKAMDLDKEFIDLANTIRKEVLQIDKVVQKTTSKYNANVVIDTCLICKQKATEVHHIKPQRVADKFNRIGTHHKNVEHNLITLCHMCHQQVENGDLDITGYTQTSNGIEAQYRKIDKKELERKKQNRKKYNKEQMDIIMGYREKTNHNINKSRKLLEIDYEIKVSNHIIKKIWSGEY